jgi:protein phosphatase 1 regulatory subunit 42
MKLIDILEQGTTLKKGKTQDRSNFLEKINHFTLNFKHLECMNGIELCKNIVILDLSENSITSISSLESCRNLRKLYLQNNNISTISGLDNLPLEILNLSCNQISFVSGLDTLIDLEILILDQQNISSMTFCPNSLQNLPVKQLSLIQCNLADIQELSLLKELQGLNLSNNKIKSIDQLEDVVCNLKKLKELQVLNNPITSNIRLFERLVVASDSLKTVNDKNISDNTRSFIRQKIRVKTLKVPVKTSKMSLETGRRSPKPVPHLPPYATQYRDLLISQIASAAQD